MPTGPLVCLFVAMLAFTALMSLVGGVDLIFAFVLPLLGLVVLLGVVGIGRGVSTLYRDLIAFLESRGNGQDV